MLPKNVAGMPVSCLHRYQSILICVVSLLKIHLWPKIQWHFYSNPSIWTNKAFFPNEASYRKEQTCPAGIIRNEKQKLLSTFFFIVSHASFCCSFKNSGFAVICVFWTFAYVVFFKFSNQNEHPSLAVSTHLLSLLRFTGV